MKTTPMFLFLSSLILVATSAVAGHHSIKIIEQENLGRYLADSDGITIYWFAKDQPDMSVCSGECLKKWPIYYRENVVAPEGVSASDFKTIERPDGTKQTSFRNYPLYYFFKDKMPGDVKGQGLKSVWFVVDPDNFPVK